MTPAGLQGAQGMAAPATDLKESKVSASPTVRAEGELLAGRVVLRRWSSPLTSQEIRGAGEATLGSWFSSGSGQASCTRHGTDPYTSYGPCLRHPKLMNVKGYPDGWLVRSCLYTRGGPTIRCLR